MKAFFQYIRNKVSTIDIEGIVKKYKITTVLTFFIIVIIIDIFGIDAFIHKQLCRSTINKLNQSVVCPEFYDIPIWSFFEIFGVIGAVVVAIWTGLSGMQVANKQAKVTEETRKDEFLPILVPVLENNIIYPSGNLNIKFQNSGKGIAKNIVISFGDFNHQTDVSIVPNSDFHEYNPQLSFPDGFFSQQEVNISFEYEDIYDRNHRTIGVIFRKSGDIFVPHSLNWKFEKDINFLKSN